MSILRTVKAVAWSFIGLRRHSDYLDDEHKLNPFHVVLVALSAVALLVGGLVLLVKWVTAG